MKTINNNIEEKWVRFDNAKLLYNKGLELGSRQAYDLLENLSWPHYGDEYTNGCSNGDCAFEAPTQQVAIDFIRINFQLHITITSISQESWQYHITKIGESLGKTFGEDFYTPEEAKEAAINHVLTIMI